MQSGLLRCRPASQKLAQVRDGTARLSNNSTQQPSPIQNFLEFNGGIRALARTQVSLCADVHWIQTGVGGDGTEHAELVRRCRLKKCDAVYRILALLFDLG